MSTLIIEDDPLFGPLVQRMVEKLGINSELAGSAESALELWESKEFDSVITDIILPKMSGLDFLSRVKPKRVIIMSGHITKNAGQNLLYRAEFLAKPFSTEELSIALRRVGILKESS